MDYYGIIDCDRRGESDSDKQQSATYRCLARIKLCHTETVLTRDENVHMQWIVTD
jgi:hypothetical protein